MKRTSINPWSWSIELGFDQAQLVEGARRQLLCSAQDSVDASGKSLHPGDMPTKLKVALDNLQEVLNAADMSFANVVRLNIHSTNVEALFQHFAILTERFGGGGERFATTVLGVSRLAGSGLMVALDATAMD
jgi:enamine deaminase RidA (YjgF/YER057c/UK114 family)